MILTCPECATSYFVDDSRVPATGRAVKCSHCGAKWNALPEAAAPPSAPQPAERAPAPAPQTDVLPPDEIVMEAPAEAPPEEDTGLRPRARRPQPAPPSRDKARERGGAVMVWVAAAAVVVGLVAGLLVFRAEVVRLVPASRGVYAKAGLANPLGLVIEDVWAEPAFQGGRPVLAVTGQIHNVKDTAANAPSLRVSLLDKAGRPLAAKVAQPIDGRVPAGAVRHFAIAIVDPPATVHDLQVTFDQPAHGRFAAMPAVRAAVAVVSGPAPVEAAPLPAGSPDALPQQHD